jgi:hypothetical protein
MAPAGGVVLETAKASGRKLSSAKIGNSIEEMGIAATTSAVLLNNTGIHVIGSHLFSSRRLVAFMWR